MFVSEFPIDNLQKFWREFLMAKQSYTPHERWSEIVNPRYKNVEFLALTSDDILYNGYLSRFTEDDEKTVVPYVYTTWEIILAKKTIIDYAVERMLPCYEFDAYFETTRLSGLFERTRELSELHEEFEKYEAKLNELYPEDDITIANILTREEKAKVFDELCDTQEYGFQFIDIFGNMLAYDFVKNYLHLNNARNIYDIFEDTGVLGNEGGYTVSNGRYTEEPYVTGDECYDDYPIE